MLLHANIAWSFCLNPFSLSPPPGMQLCPKHVCANTHTCSIVSKTKAAHGRKFSCRRSFLGKHMHVSELQRFATCGSGAYTSLLAKTRSWKTNHAICVKAPLFQIRWVQTSECVCWLAQFLAMEWILSWRHVATHLLTLGGRLRLRLLNYLGALWIRLCLCLLN